MKKSHALFGSSLRSGAIFGALAVSAALLAGCSSKQSEAGTDSTATATTAASSTSLTGAGSTFVNPIMTHWAPEYTKETGVAVNYQSVGSGAGINDLIDHTVDIGASDAPMNPDELARAKDPVIQVPDVIGAVCVSYNVGGMQSGLHMSGPVLANIYLGKIKMWDDPQIKKMNPGKKLPHAAIFTVHRSDGSGTTAIFSDYLSKVSPDWKSTVGEGKEVKWPVGIGGKGNEGVAGVLKQHENSIGYIELAYAMENSIPFSDMENSSGNFITPSVASATEASKAFPMPENMLQFITNTSAPQGYPITGFSWLMFFPNGPKADQVKKFMNWVVTTGQKDNEALYYAPIPQSVVAAVQPQLQTAAAPSATNAPAQ